MVRGPSTRWRCELVSHLPDGLMITGMKLMLTRINTDDCER